MKREMAMIVVAVAVLLGAANVDSKQASPPAVDCSTLVLGMADCLTFVTNGSTIGKPEGQCCSGLKTVLRTDAQCLCDAFKNSASFGVALNLTKALALPTACHVTAPSAKNCGVSLSPTGAPVSSPAGAPGSFFDANAPSSAGASEVSPSPSPTPGKNASPVLGVSLRSIVLCLAGAIFSSL